MILFALEEITERSQDEMAVRQRAALKDLIEALPGAVYTAVAVLPDHIARLQIGSCDIALWRRLAGQADQRKERPHHGRERRAEIFVETGFSLET